jgi:transcriptional regulator with PAS, ATPase and Fis domain
VSEIQADLDVAKTGRVDAAHKGTRFLDELGDMPLRAGTFRADIFFRLSGGTIRLPPLRERPRDIPALARLFLARHCTAQTRARARDVDGGGARARRARVVGERSRRPSTRPS